jgi:hypothetical protein
MKTGISCLLIIMISCLIQPGNLSFASDRPVIKVDQPYPTADKPQSKLWYMYDSWWAILPMSSGPSLWRRTEKGWKEYPEVTAKLRSVPGRVDVWADDRQVTAVGVGTHSLTVFRLIPKKKSSKIEWETQVLAELVPPSSDIPIETATIARDDKGFWWVTATADRKVCVWSSSSALKNWSPPVVLANGIEKDDICVITPLPDGVGVIWSDQAGDAVMMRKHISGNPAGKWEDPEVIDKGNKTADDHLHTSMASNGTLWVATKNSVDQTGKPQLVLRVRSVAGHWRNIPYACLDSVLKPSRPVVIATEDPSIILAGHTIYNAKNSFRGEIVFGQVDTMQNRLLNHLTTIIVPDTVGWMKNNRINDITGSRKPLPMNIPWIVLASDGGGRVYEADLRKFFFK